MLELRTICENCGKKLPPDSEEAMICTFECTFCKGCVEQVLENVCPNCNGGFEKRPVRPRSFLKNLGNMFNQKEKAQAFNLKIYDIFNQYKLDKRIKVAYLIWKKPYMTIGSDTFIHHLLQQLGFDNIFAEHKRYPVIEMQDLDEAEIIMLSSEPYPFQEKHLEEFRAIYPDKKIMIVDGEAFSWYGTHIAKCEAYYKELVTTIEAH